MPAERSANKTLNSTDTGIDFVHSFVSAGYESLCPQVSFIKSLEGVIKLLVLNVWVYAVLRDNLSIKAIWSL